MLPTVTHPLPTNVSLIKSVVAAAAVKSMAGALRAKQAAGSASAFWYNVATNTRKKNPAPPGLQRRDAVNVHRLRLGYRCMSMLQPENPAPVECPHCEEEMLQPLLHYLLECRGTRHLLQNLEGLAAPALVRSLGDEELINLVRLYLPPY